jgi:alpha-glucuronidase
MYTTCVEVAGLKSGDGLGEEVISFWQAKGKMIEISPAAPIWKK